MVNRLRLNEKSVREAEPEKGRDYQIFDTEVRGFAVCIYRSGNRAFTIDYRHSGRQRRMTIGRWPEWSTTAARERAKELRREIDAGGDPLGQKESGRDAPRVKDLIDRYVEVHLPKLAARNAADQRSMLARMVMPDWGNKLVTEIAPYDVEKLLNKVALGRARPSKEKPNNRARKLQGAKPTPVRANRVGEVLRKMFTYAVSWGWREDNPASSFHRRIENPRERFLTQEEIRKLAEALDGAEDRRAADILRLCMLTGARVGEVRQARFEHFHLEQLTWSKPATMTKQRKVHRLPISDEAASIVVSYAAGIATARIGRDGLDENAARVGTDITADFRQTVHLLDMDSIYADLVQWKGMGKRWNIRFERQSVATALASGPYEIWALPSFCRVESRQDIQRLQIAATTVARKLFESAYRKFEAKHSRYELIAASDSGIPSKYFKETSNA